MSLPTYQIRGDNSPLTTDNYISKTVGCNTNSSLTNKNDSNFLATYPKQGNIKLRSPSPSPRPSPSPALAKTRFYITNFIVRSPDDIEQNSNFPNFYNSYDYAVYLDNYFMYDSTYYMNKPTLTYFNTGNEQFDGDINDKGFLFILSEDRVPYYITNNFNKTSELNKFIITKRRDLTSYYSAFTPPTTVSFDLLNPSISRTNAITRLQLFPASLRQNIDFTLFYNFRLYNTNLRVIRGVQLSMKDSGLEISDNEQLDSSFNTTKFESLQDVFYDNFNKINTISPDLSFYTAPTNIITSDLSNFYVYDKLSNAFYLTIGDLDKYEVFVTKKPNPSISPENGNDIDTSKIYYKIMDSNGNFISDILDTSITFKKVSPTFNEEKIVSFKNATDVPIVNPIPAPVPAPVPGGPVVIPGPVPEPSPIGAPPTITAGVYPTNLRIVERSASAATYTPAFIDIVPNNAAAGYYVDHTIARQPCTPILISQRKCYTMIPVGCNQNKLGFAYTVNEASNNNGASKLSPNTTVGTPALSWANVLNNTTNNTDKITQPVKDQRAYLSNVLNINTAQLNGGTANIAFRNFDNPIVYYSNNNSTLPSGRVLTQSEINNNLYVKHESGWYFKILPQDTALMTTPYKFKFFWRITNHKSPPNRMMFVTLSNTDIPTVNFVNSNATNIKIAGPYMGLTNFSISTR